MPTIHTTYLTADEVRRLMMWAIITNRPHSIEIGMPEHNQRRVTITASDDTLREIRKILNI